MSDEYPDLASWIRPGAKVAALSLDAAWMVTVTRITATQIICTSDTNKSAIYRFYREERQLFGQEHGHRAVGDRLVKLARRDHTQVVQFRIRDVISDLRDSMRKAVTPSYAKDRRSQDEIAMDLLDQLENKVRKARRKVEQLLDPGGAVAAEYAAEHGQQLEPTEA